jgi:hypothetical protein
VKDVSLTDYCIDKDGEIILGRQAEAARLLDVTPHAVKKMLSAGRDITLTFDDEGKYIDHIEKSKVGSGKRPLLRAG